MEGGERERGDMKRERNEGGRGGRDMIVHT